MEIEEAQAKKQDVEVLSVLIADDDAPTRMLLRAAIKQWNYAVVEARDGEEVWDILQKPDAPRLLILDWLMPKLTGTEVAARIRHELSFHPYIILLTQVSGTDNIIKGLEAGADEFLSKPFNMAELRSRLSVGARLIRNEKSLAHQRGVFQDYLKQLAAHISGMQDGSRYIDELIKAQEANGLTDCLRKIQELNNKLKNSINEMKKIQIEPEKVKGQP